jgi:hypothetical protein
MVKANWLKLHRRIMNSDVAQSDELLGLFVRLLAAVNYESRFFKAFKVESGSMVFAWRNLPKRLYPKSKHRPSINTLRRRIDILKAMGMVVTQSHDSQKFSVLTVPNWQKYQSKTVSKIDTVADTVADTVTDTENRRNKKDKNTSSKLRFDQKDFEFSERMFSRILEVAPKTKKPNFEKWANTVRLMREADGHSLDEIRQVFEWANLDPFWKTNILSPDKLRSQFSVLDAKRGNASSSPMVLKPFVPPTGDDPMKPKRRAGS